MRLFVWGILDNMQKFYFPDYVEVLGGVDADEKKQNRLFYGKKIIAPEELKNYQYDYILISSIQRESKIMNQINQLGIKKEVVIPAELFEKQIHNQLEQMQEYIATSENVKIIKNWYQNGKEREIIVNIKGKIGYRLKLSIFPYQCFNKEVDSTKGKVMDLASGEYFYQGEWKGYLELEISLDSNSTVLKISVEGNDGCFLGIKLEEGRLLKRVRQINSMELQESLLRNLNYCQEQRYHEKDYSILEQFGNVKDYTILDIGANVGQSTISFLKLTQMDIIAVEPQPIMIEALQLIQEEFGKGRLRIENKGIGELGGKN